MVHGAARLGESAGRRRTNAVAMAGRAWQAYARSMANRPLLTNMATAAVVMGFGDAAAQALTPAAAVAPAAPARPTPWRSGDERAASRSPAAWAQEEEQGIAAAMPGRNGQEPFRFDWQRNAVCVVRLVS